MTFKKLAQVFCYYFLPVFLAGLLSFLIYTDNTHEFRAETGEIALTLLVLLLAIRPLSQIFWKVKVLKKLVSIRRELGIGMFYIALAHGASYVPIIWQFPQVLTTPFVYIGLLAFFNTFLLYITSNNYSLKLLKQNWKKLHMSVYVLLILSSAHAYLATDDVEWIIKTIVTVLLLGGLNLLVKNKVRVPKLSQK